MTREGWGRTTARGPQRPCWRQVDPRGRLPRTLIAGLDPATGRLLLRLKGTRRDRALALDLVGLFWQASAVLDRPRSQRRRKGA